MFFYRHIRAAQFIRGTLHRYSAFPYVLRLMYTAGMMIGAALWNAKQTGLDKLQAVREKLADLVCYRESINAHLTASIAMGGAQPGGAADAAAIHAAGPVHSAGLCLVREVPWPVADLRVDWTEDCPIAGLDTLWTRYRPQLDHYVTRALNPGAAPGYGVPGDP